MTDIRAALAQRLQASGHSMQWLSLQLGRNKAYVQQFIERGSPKDLGLEAKIRIAELLKMPLSELGVSDYDIRKRRTSNGAGFNEDAEPFLPPEGSFLSTSAALGYMRMRSDVLSQHPLKIEPGKLLAFNLSPGAVEAVKSEDIVIVQCYSRTEALAAFTIIREFVRPNLLITNRETDNEIIVMGDPSLAFEPHIKGVLRAVVADAD